MKLRIDEDRLWRSHMEMAEIGATARDGVCRLAASPEDGAARDRFAAWCQKAGLKLRVDRIGNMFARRRGVDDNLAPLMIGSHLDSQPTGGKFDGTYGVLTGLEIVRWLNDNEMDTRRPIEIVNWTNEEGCRYQPSTLGAQVFAGLLSLEDGLAREDLDGKRLCDELSAIGYLGDAPAVGQSAYAYLEAHIEQGPILEELGLQVGIVEGGMGVNAYEVVLTGLEAHTGATPVERRRDALLGAAGIVLAVNQLARRYEPDGRATVAHMRITPNVRSVVPGRVVITSDCRHKSPEALDRMTSELNGIFVAEAGKCGVTLESQLYWSAPAISFDADCVAALVESADGIGSPYHKMHSGAGHDAIPISQVMPAAMVFVRSKDGLSHNEAEYSSPEDLALGCEVMLGAALNLAGK